MPSSDKLSRIPVGSGFTPGTVDLPEFVKAVVAHSGDRAAIQKAVNASPVRLGKASASEKTRSLPVEAAVQYGLIDKDDGFKATALAVELAALAPADLYRRFGQHIMHHHAGLRVVESIEHMRADGRKVTRNDLARHLSDHGFLVTEQNSGLTAMRGWLAEAGLFPKSGRGAGAWHPDPAVKASLVGLDDDTIAALAGLNDDQVAFARALARLDPTGWVAANSVRDLAEQADGVRMDRTSLPKSVLKPLADAGLIEYKAGGTTSGKSSQLRTTPSFRSDVLTPFLDHALKDLDAALSAYYRKRPDDIYTDLDSKDSHVKGQALEAFAVLVMRLLGLRFAGWRRRAEETGYAEVDVLMSGLFGAVPTTWQVQCKNTPAGTVRLEDVAKEVGLIPLTRATHVMVLANAPFTGDARRYANAIMQNSSVTIFLVGKDDFAAIRTDPANLGRILRTQAERIRDLKLNTGVWRERSSNSGHQDDQLGLTM